jgi:16S rRNA (guanine527-N7)-methyltransferase
MAEGMRDLLEEVGRRYEVALSERQIQQFLCYLRLIQKWQRTAVRLVGSVEAGELVSKHVSDALALYNCLGECKGKKLMDIGSGAGFPGVCLRLFEPGLEVTLVEASGRKAAFLAKVKAELVLSGVNVVRARAEDIAWEEGFRGGFDLVTMRAVASLARAVELGLPFVRAGGCLFLVRGKSSAGEIETAESVAARLGGGSVVVRDMSIEGMPGRGSIMIVGKGTASGWIGAVGGPDGCGCL